MATVAVCGRIARQTHLGRHIGRVVTCLYHQLAPTEQTASGCPFHQPANIAEPSAVKPFDRIPTPRALPLIGTTLDVLASGGAPRIHEYCDKRHKELGPIFRESLGSVDAVFVADSEMIKSVYQHEGKHPMHLVPEPWVLYNNRSGEERGLFFMDGPLWEQRRKSLNKVLMRQTTVTQHAQVFNGVVTDLLNRWRDQRDETGILKNLEKELYNWSIESVGTMIFGRRLGCLQTGDDKSSMHGLVKCVQNIFQESANMTLIPPRLAYSLKLPVWKRFERAVDTALLLAKEYVEQNLSEVLAKSEAGEPVDGILSQLLLKEDIKEEEIVKIVVDLFLAAADTTSHATQWSLYLLGRNPDCQERLLNEIKGVVKPGEEIDEHHLQHLPYVKGIVKEALRLYPVAPFLTRILSQDLSLGGYQVPAGKLILMSKYTTGRDPKNFPNPEKFEPERWIRKTQQEVVNTHACIPFGVGPRSCIGRRVAETIMHFLIARTIQTFRLESANKEEVRINMRLITTPDEPILLRAIERT